METAHPELLIWLILILFVLILPSLFHGSERRPREDRTMRDRWFLEDQRNWHEWEEHHHEHDEHHGGHDHF